MTPRASDPSAGVGGQPPVAAPLSVNALPRTRQSPLADRPGTTGAASAPVMVPAPTPGGSRTAVIVPPPPTPYSDRQDRREPSPFSLRKVVAATPPTDPTASHDDVLVGPLPPSCPRAAVPTVSTPSAEIAAVSEPTDESAPPDDRRSAIIAGLRWTMIGRPVVEVANLLGVAVLARLVAPAEFGRYAIALIVLTLANVPTQAVQYSIVQRTQIDRDHLKTGVTLTVLMGLAICGLCVVACYTVIPTVFGARTAVLVLLMTPACLINSVNTVQVAIITRRLEFRRLTLLDLTITLVGSAASIAMAVIGLNGERRWFSECSRVALRATSWSAAGFCPPSRTSALVPPATS